MSKLEELRSRMVAEDLFAFLGVAYDAEVLRRYRTHVLHRFALEADLVDRLHPSAPEEERLDLYRAALARAHALFRR